MNFFTITCIITFITNLSIAVLFLIKVKSKSIGKNFGWTSLASFTWAFGALFLSMSDSIEAASFWLKIAHTGIVLTPTFFTHFVITFTNSKAKFLRIFVYSLAITYLLLNFFYPNFYEVKFVFNQFYFFQASLAKNPIYTIYYLTFYWCTLLYAFVLLLKFFTKTTGNLRNQVKYFLIGMVVAWLGPEGMFLLVFGLPLYPYTNLLIAAYPLILAYAILKYRLMDVNIALTRVGIFITVYSIILGIPFWIGIKYLGKGPWLIPTGICAALATAGPFIYLFLQRKAEQHILQEEVRTQNLLLQASYGMNTIHDLNHLVNLIVEVVMKILRVGKAEIYLLAKDGSQYQLGAPKHDNNLSPVISASDPFIETLKNNKFPIVYEEIKIHSENANNVATYPAVTKQMENLSASVAVPIIISGTLLGFLTLTDRKSKEVYSRDLLNALTVLGNQAALAIENCHYLEAETKRMEEEGVRERMVSLDHMASSMAHEIDNPNTVILNQADLIIEAMDRDPRTSIPEEIKKDIISGLRYIQESSTRVSEMIRAVLEYSRMGTGQLKPIKIYAALESFEKLISPELKKTRVDIKKKVGKDLPFILGDKIQIEEIFINLTTNALHAIKHKEGEKRIELVIFKKDDKFIRIEFSDNGYGIAKNMLSDIFLASVTTKGSVEGTGLGLYRVRKIVDKHKGKIWAESEGKDKGARFVIELPIHKEELSDIIKEDNGKPIRTKKVF